MTIGPAEIESLLRERLSPTRLEVADESARHAGHKGARESGGGHFQVVVVSAAFSGKTHIERHRMVYQALGELFPAQIHALALQTLAPEEDR